MQSHYPLELRRCPSLQVLNILVYLHLQVLFIVGEKVVILRPVNTIFHHLEHTKKMASKAVILML